MTINIDSALGKKTHLVLVPAYGRAYETEADVTKDWNEGKDFQIQSGPYCSIRDISDMKNQFDTVLLWWHTVGDVIVL